jgi:hypothetical protein
MSLCCSKVVITAGAAQECVDAWEHSFVGGDLDVQDMTFRSDRAVPPRCLLSLFLASTKQPSFVDNLWPSTPYVNQVEIQDGAIISAIYLSELQLFTTWFLHRLNFICVVSCVALCNLISVFC